MNGARPDLGTGVDALRRTLPFRNVSLRLLTDAISSLDPMALQPGDAVDIEAGQTLIPLDGAIEIGTHGPGPTIEIAAGTLWTVPRETGARLRVVNKSAKFARVVRIADDAAMGLGLALRLGSTAAWRPPAPGEARGHFNQIWLTQQPGMRAPLEALGVILTIGLGRQFAEPAHLVVQRAGATSEYRWDRTADRLVALDRNPDIAAHEDAAVPEQTPFHVVYVNAEQPETPPTLRVGRTFRRIVYVSDCLVPRMPERLRFHLHDEARRGAPPDEPLFCSFIPTILVRGQGSARESRARSGALGDPPSRVLRDTRRLVLDADEIWRAWDRARCEAGRDHHGSAAEGTALAFARGDSIRSDAIRQCAERWARAVTNRQVGLGISGGGATSYRMVPLLQGLGESGVPVDLVSGVSGGVMIAAYYCHGGIPGLARAIDNGWLHQLVILGAVASTENIRRFVNWEFRGARIGDLEVRLVPVTVALRPRRPPEGTVIRESSLGTAVQMSGSAPGLFAPTSRGSTRYVDGGLASMLPTRVLKDYGADVVFACNTLAGPTQRNPLAGLPGAELAYRHTLLGRVIDLWVSGASLAQKISLESAKDAVAAFSPEAQRRPLIEAFRFDQAREIATDAAADPQLARKHREFTSRWHEYRDEPANP